MFWTDMINLSSSMWANSLALAETATATHKVVGHRSRTIDTAFRNPFAADLEELGRIVPEKMAAFGQAGTAVAEDWLAIQTDLLAQSGDMTMLFFGGWPPNRAAVERIGTRSSRLAVAMSRAGGRALAPIHAKATANQRRLGKSKAP